MLEPKDYNQHDYYSTVGHNERTQQNYDWSTSFNINISQADLSHKEQCLQSFDYSGRVGGNDPNNQPLAGYYSPMNEKTQEYSYSTPPQVYMRQKFQNQHSKPLAHEPYFQPPPGTFTSSSVSAESDQEPPLLEELGIDPDHIFQKMLVVLNPLTETDEIFLTDDDLAGPLAFVSAFAGLLLLSGKVHFSYIYGISVLGCLAMYTLLNLMTVLGVTLCLTVSILGYCLFPMVVLSGISALVPLQGSLGIALTAVATLWCSFSASSVFVSALKMEDQLLLVAYPCGLLYGIFALLAIF